jgi:hypothetical protein
MSGRGQPEKNSHRAQLVCFTPNCVEHFRGHQKVGSSAAEGFCRSAVFFCLSEIADTNTAEVSKMLAEVTNRETLRSPALPQEEVRTAAKRTFWNGAGYRRSWRAHRTQDGGRYPGF